MISSIDTIFLSTTEKNLFIRQCHKQHRKLNEKKQISCSVKKFRISHSHFYQIGLFMSPLSNSLFASQLFATSIFSGIDSIPQKSPIETKPYLWHGQPLLCSLSRLASESSLTRDILHSHVAPSHGEILYLVPRPPVGNKQFDDPAIYKVPRLI